MDPAHKTASSGAALSLSSSSEMAAPALARPGGDLQLVETLQRDRPSAFRDAAARQAGPCPHDGDRNPLLVRFPQDVATDSSSGWHEDRVRPSFEAGCIDDVVLVVEAVGIIRRRSAGCIRDPERLRPIAEFVPPPSSLMSQPFQSVARIASASFSKPKSPIREAPVLAAGTFSHGYRRRASGVWKESRRVAAAQVPMSGIDKKVHMVGRKSGGRVPSISELAFANSSL